MQGINIRENNYVIHWIEIYPCDNVIHHLNNWRLEQYKNGESPSPRARWGEATFKGVVVVWSETMYISGVITRC